MDKEHSYNGWFCVEVSKSGLTEKQNSENGQRFVCVGESVSDVDVG